MRDPAGRATVEFADPLSVGTNVCSATTLGIVGAGGIGQTLYESLRSFHYADSAAQMIIIVVTVVAIDMASARIRKGLI